MSEIEKLSDLELLHMYAGCEDMKLYQESEKELLKRLQNNNIESFKKEIVSRIKESHLIVNNKTDEELFNNLRPLIEVYKKAIIDLINNIK